MTPARPVTWSDEELRKAWGETLVFQGKPATLRQFLGILGAIHPQEHAIAKREAQREAVEAWWLENTIVPAYVWTRWLDKHYPSLPPSPPPLVLANGTRVERRESGYRYVITAPTGTKYHGNSLSPLGAYCTTNEDFTAIAKWLQEAK